ncbi:M23 family metallopeptidase [Hydrogenimonas cancrithermarum]|uniref:Peptidase n=1 Tax=Hydrogenimonas cancrithermarum TaxID=2993563 RepID=A0ABM8FM15_9BACT|nr:M23 family metallopeptidase [Hydrogenimonas cancrithermarum]BDY13386.1 peptidase [Hydrogenimonas cancrithermarum]
MKHKILITITDTGSFRQYTLSQILKWVVLALFFALVLAGAATYLYMKWLEEANEMAKRRQEVLERNIAALNLQIEKRQNALDRLGDRLSDLEILVGEKPDTGISTSTRLENVTLSAAQLALLFSIVPNGDPLPMEGVTSAFGWRRHPIRKCKEFHAGIDLRAKHGKPVWTTADGVVEYAGYHKRSGYGNLVIVDHGFGFKTYYGHLKKLTVRTGDTVIKGDVIGLSGNTGLSTAPHLHYEIRFLSRPLNPYWFLKWRRDAYTSIFKKVKQVPWESFIALVSHMAAQAIPPSSPPEQK